MDANRYFPRLPTHLLALTQTCSAIRNECRLMPYILNTFEFQDKQAFYTISTSVRDFCKGVRSTTGVEVNSIVVNAGKVSDLRPRKKGISCVDFISVAEDLRVVVVNLPEC